MDKKKNTIDEQIEQLRLAMYEAYSRDPSGVELLLISQQLDKILNKEFAEKNRSKEKSS
ncbi:Spo0E family sporulation regulatory protein-aspartic acid phosphatase [Aquibacillus halophilus]|uniref:Spo0E family sporulation regulatory protein-aspartic acid phosphatase n=1 Tax=Aquibacillus halophilus TaxID=930132 RepID=A0A6A8DQE7_9BACI|nr:Spo0E family sporulation regulatory protein-aspartic acid phosphatase [Aquibacillus halophilus]MRH43452.1 Spo0E family sporulation regulatory protein-aspartic acid phosphatase [Aquibacillus halophilus]